MSRVVWLNGSFSDAATAALSIDDPGVRAGAGLFETMRCQDGRVPLLERHLARMTRSAAALRLTGTPDDVAVREAVLAVAARLPAGPARLRVTVTPHPTLLVEAEAITLDPALTLTAASIRGTWSPGRWLGEHKTLSFLGWRDAQRRAEEAGADIALLLDRAGRLGEASTANVFCVVDGTLVTPPVDGILPGITRALVLDLADVREEALEEGVWRGAEELFVTSAVRGVVPVTHVDGAAVGQGLQGPITTRIRQAVERALSGEGVPAGR